MDVYASCEDCGKTFTREEYEALEWYDGPRCNRLLHPEAEFVEAEYPRDAPMCGGIVSLEEGMTAEEQKEKCELIEEFLIGEGYSKEDRREDETMEVEAQSLVLRLGLNRMTPSELRKFLGK